MAESIAVKPFGRIKRIPVTRRERWAWYFYDFGNSGYAAVILLAVYSAYFKTTVVGGAQGLRLWGYSVGVAMLVVALVSPVLGVMADFRAAKKKMLVIFTVLSVVFTAMLFFVQKGDVALGMMFFILAEIGYRGGQVFYNALLPEISDQDSIGNVSGNGWAFGSFGGIICLLLVLPLILIFKGTLMVRISFLIAAAFYGLSSIPIFLHVRERKEPEPLPKGETSLSISLKRLKNNWTSVGDYKQFLLFIVAYIIFNNGIMMTLDFASIIGAVLFNMNQQQLIIFMIIVQFTSVIGAFVFGKLSHAWTSKISLGVAVLCMILAVSGLFMVKSLFVFNIIGAMAGFALTGVQSVSRTSVGQLAPVEKSAEFFGIFSLANQLSAFTGPALYGTLATALAFKFERMGGAPIPSELAGMRLAVLAMVISLSVGLIVLVLFVHNWQKKPSTQVSE